MSLGISNEPVMISQRCAVTGCTGRVDTLLRAGMVVPLHWDADVSVLMQRLIKFCGES